MLTYDMNDRGSDPLYVHLYRCIQRDIAAGRLTSGQRMPPKRSLAEHLGVSLVTVETAYSQLIAEGYLRSKPRSGYFVCPVPAPANPWGTMNRPEEPGCATRPNPNEDQHDAPLFDLTNGALPAQEFPFATWAKTMRETLAREAQAALVEECDPLGAPELRAAIAAHLETTRGFVADPACIVVGAGAQVLYNLVVQLLGRNRTVGVEDPGYARLTRIYELNDMDVRHVPLDQSGITLDSVRASGASMLHIMPSHQFPTGAVMPVARRYELLAWANEAPDRYILEDDYDCEFRLAGRPVPTLASMDASGRVIYANTFSRSLGAAFRVAYLALPPKLAADYRSMLGFYSCTVPGADQLALARFMGEGHFERHVRRMKTRCRSVRDAFLDALANVAPKGSYRIHGADSGLHFLIELQPQSRPNAGNNGASAFGASPTIARNQQSIVSNSGTCGIALAARTDQPKPTSAASDGCAQALARALAECGMAVKPLAAFCQNPETAQSPFVRRCLVINYASLAPLEAHEAGHALGCALLTQGSGIA